MEPIKEKEPNYVSANNALLNLEETFRDFRDFIDLLEYGEGQKDRAEEIDGPCPPFADFMSSLPQRLEDILMGFTDLKDRLGAII